MPHYNCDGVTIHLGDCLDMVQTMEPNSIDAIVTDPPYGIRFMGKAWDGKDIEAMYEDRLKYSTDPDRCTGVRGGHRSKAAHAGKYDRSLTANQKFQHWCQSWGTAMLRIAKPGAYLVVFGSPRTYHRLTCAIEDAGWEIRDCLMWVFGSGFPKSLDVSKAIDKAAGATRKIVSHGKPVKRMIPGADQNSTGSWIKDNGREYVPADTMPNTNEAKRWDGWGTGLKPAYEPILLARKPLDGTVAQNVLKWGTGAMNIDACRVSTSDVLSGSGSPPLKYGGLNGQPFLAAAVPRGVNQSSLGRWPANLCHDGGEEALAAFPSAPGQLADASTNSEARKTQHVYGSMRRGRGNEPSADSENAGEVGFNMKPGLRRLDEGSAARFFYTAKASASDRGHEEWDALPLFGDAAGTFKNSHPTVKPLALMRYLLTLVSREGSLILDPFMGSGSTLVAGKQLGRRMIGTEIDVTYADISVRRLKGLKL